MSEKNILVVEDDDDARQLLCMILTSLGYSTIAYAGGPEALKRCCQIRCRSCLTRYYDAENEWL